MDVHQVEASEDNLIPVAQIKVAPASVPGRSSQNRNAWCDHFLKGDHSRIMIGRHHNLDMSIAHGDQVQPVEVAEKQ